MSLRAIPDQPIDFTPKRVKAYCDDSCIPLLVAIGDPLIFQFLQDRCDGASQYLEPISPDDWIDDTGWVIGEGILVLVPGNGGTYVEESLWSASIGSIYEVEVEVTEISGDGVFVVVGGVQRAVFSPGVHKWVVEAQASAGVRIVSIGDTSAAQVTRVQVWDANRSFSVAVMSNDVEVAVYDPINNADLFVYEGQHVTFYKIFDLDLDGTLVLELRDGCTEERLCSNPIKVTKNCRDTIAIRVCNDVPATGFVPGVFQARVHASIVRPSWTHQVSEEVLTNGTVNTHFVERSQRYQLHVESTDISVHGFLSMLPMFDHMYLDAVPWQAIAEGHEPLYGDAQNSSGAVIMSIRPQVSSVRRVMCEDVGDGCSPDQDPICNSANATISVELVDGQLHVLVFTYGSMGFVIGQIQYSINDVPQEPVTVNGEPGAYDLGVVDEGDLVSIVFTNLGEPQCPDDRGVLVVAAPGACDDAKSVGGCSHVGFFFVVDEIFSTLEISQVSSSTGFWSLKMPDGSVQTFQNGDGGITDFAPQGGGYCAYVSDANGVPQPGIWYNLYVKGFGSTGPVLHDVDWSDVVIEQDPGAITPGVVFGFDYAVFDVSPDFRGVGPVTILVFNGCQVPSLPTIADWTSLREVYMTANAGITVAPDFSGMSPQIRVARLSGMSLPSSEVDRVLNEFFAVSGEDNGEILMNNQTPAAPRTSASDSAYADLISRGYAITLDV